MVKINGVNIANTQEQKREHTPTINQILDMMENNYQSINNKQNNGRDFGGQTQGTSNQSYLQNYVATPQSTEKAGVEDKSNLLMSILPAMLSQNKASNGLSKQKDMLVKELLKNTQNPMLGKLFQLLPQLTSKNGLTSSQNSESPAEAKKEVPKIDTFKKTDDYSE